MLLMTFLFLREDGGNIGTMSFVLDKNFETLIIEILQEL